MRPPKISIKTLCMRNLDPGLARSTDIATQVSRRYTWSTPGLSREGSETIPAFVTAGTNLCSIVLHRDSNNPNRVSPWSSSRNFIIAETRWRHTHSLNDVVRNSPGGLFMLLPPFNPVKHGYCGPLYRG